MFLRIYCAGFKLGFWMEEVEIYFHASPPQQWRAQKLKTVINSGVGGAGIRDEVCQLVSFRQFDWDEASDCVICKTDIGFLRAV